MVEKKIIKIVSISILLISWIFLIIIKYLSNELSLKVPLIITIIISIISIISFFGDKIIKLSKIKEEKFPNSINEKELMELIKKQVENMWNHLLIKGGIGESRSEQINKNLIYACKINLLYKEEFGNSCWIIINANYPGIKPTILKPDSSEHLIRKAMNYKSVNPLEEPDIEETVIENPLSGTKSTTKKVMFKNNEKEKKEEVV